jgi:hypothetical protein
MLLLRQQANVGTLHPRAQMCRCLMKYLRVLRRGRPARSALIQPVRCDADTLKKCLDFTVRVEVVSELHR